MLIDSSKRLALCALLSAAALAMAGAAPVPPPDRQAPTKPTSLHTGAVGPYSVALSWNASSDNSGVFSYVVQASNGYTLSVPQSQTSATFSTNIYPRNSYTFSVYAVDAAGNRSQASNSVRATLPADTTTPSTPVVTVADIGATYVTLNWSATDNDPVLDYFVFIDGVQAGHSTWEGSGTFFPFAAGSTHTVTVKARDTGLNFSAASAPLTFTTDPVDATDTTPPTPVSGLAEWHYPFDREMNVTWTQSTDNVDAPQGITYEVYVNGELADVVTGRGASISYGVFGHNVITVIARDSAGNPSEPVSIETDI